MGSMSKSCCEDSRRDADCCCRANDIRSKSGWQRECRLLPQDHAKFMTALVLHDESASVAPSNEME